MNLFQKKVFGAVKNIPLGQTRTYKEIAKIIGHPRAYRAVGNILNKNRNPQVPCHRVIRSDGQVGGYNKGTKKKANMLKDEVIKVIKKGGIGVLPTDTIYGLVGSAFSKKTVEKIYRIKRRKKNKPFIILISSLNDLKLFNIKLDKMFLGILRKIWPDRVSIILPCKNKKFLYLHRGKNSLAFRMPKDLWLRKFLTKTGPLVAPSANLESLPPAQTIKQAKKYFGDKIDFYFNKGKLKGKPSIILEIKR